ncbi:hypothetical protein EV06_1563 [Prochlorococcus sp. MIT 0602]|nr:hypothetical protein EV06_1563 [Prochlorococcus sp. MIT 0602]KGG16069.1 hypothetical protein EV07_2037 [Prochlorococcus sp. MIT 0603]
MGNKFSLFAASSLLSLVASLFLRFWGIQHPQPFLIRPFIVLGMLFGPSIILVFYLAFTARQTQV